MRKIRIIANISLDGVIQSPGLTSSNQSTIRLFCR
jgi:hypothetical protein